jgi:hypothetical protein
MKGLLADSKNCQFLSGHVYENRTRKKDAAIAKRLSYRPTTA